MGQKTIKEWAITILIIVCIAGAGLFVVNQFFAWQYKTYLLQAPCDLCVSLNPNYTRCYVQDLRNPPNESNTMILPINWSLNK